MLSRFEKMRLAAWSEYGRHARQETMASEIGLIRKCIADAAWPWLPSWPDFDEVEIGELQIAMGRSALMARSVWIEPRRRNRRCRVASA
jgi:hypothetical protein